MKPVLITLLVSFFFWLLLFFPPLAPLTPFWPMMTVSVMILSGWTLWIRRRDVPGFLSFTVHHIWWGIFTAMVLYGIFWAGKELISRIFIQSTYFIQSVYQTKQNTSPWMTTMLLLCIIGPGEEIFWRGYIQHSLMRAWGRRKGYIVAVILYALVHIWALNPLLIVAALLCGFLWGGLYLRFRSLWPAIISHAVWDVMIFVVLPLAP